MGFEQEVPNFSVFDRRNTLGLEDPKQATLHLALVLQVGVSKKELKVFVAQGKLKLQHLKIFALLIYKGKSCQRF